MKKACVVLIVSKVDRQRLAVFNLERSAWEGWKSMIMDVKQDSLTWAKFKKRFNVMFMPEITKNVVERQLLDLPQGDMIAN